MKVVISLAEISESDSATVVTPDGDTVVLSAECSQAVIVATDGAVVSIDMLEELKAGGDEQNA